jgi:diguanylate cyclase (GGDEF)-like protein/PAS domain S-box-containing protein
MFTNNNDRYLLNSFLNKILFCPKCIILLSLLFGLLVWFSDAILDYFFLYDNNETFLEVFATNPPINELIIRLAILVCFIIFGVVFSIIASRRIEAENYILEQKYLLQSVIDASPNYIFVKDREGRYELANKAIADAFNTTADKIIGRFDIDFNNNKSETDKFRNDETDVLKYEKEIFVPEEKYTTKKHGVLWMQTTKKPLLNENGSIEYILGVATDITHRKNYNETLVYQASHDSLTGLVNRREFNIRLETLLSNTKQNASEHALCFMDIDQFKVVNDTCGHAAGDELLRQLSSYLANVLRESDTLARLGGDEFGVIFENCSLENALQAATHIQNKAQHFRFNSDGHNFKLGVSIGLVHITQQSTNITDILRDADAACYIAKENGRNRIHVYDANDFEITQRHSEIQWIARINQALEEDRFCLYAQIIESIDDPSKVHYEFLIRMIGENGENIAPGCFLPAAENYNIISKLDYWVIKNAFNFLKNNYKLLERKCFFSINLSGQSITNKEFHRFVSQQLHESGIDGTNICFEITETAAITNLSLAKEFISSLNKDGCKFALDDFGSGLSSFGYLKNLSVDYLKIDGMFIKNIVDDVIDRAMVNSINEIGQIMGMKTIAEFVENDEITQQLKIIGVNYAQGYGIGKPMPINEIINT